MPEEKEKGGKIHYAGLLGRLERFDHQSSDFRVFSERINQFSLANDIDDDNRKRAILLNILSEETYILLRNLCVPNLSHTETYKDLTKILKEYFTPVKSICAERLVFYNAKRRVMEVYKNGLLVCVV